MKNLKKIKNKKGFTLIEMVIVITIIGILSSIAVTKYSTVQENAKKNADYATAANLATAAMISISDGHDSTDDISPTGLFSKAEGPALPVKLTHTSTFKISRPWLAIYAATSLDTTPKRSIISVGTLRILIFSSVAYVTIEPLKKVEAPGIEVMVDANNPPVKDSAAPNVKCLSLKCCLIFSKFIII